MLNHRSWKTLTFGRIADAAAGTVMRKTHSVIVELSNTTPTRQIPVGCFPRLDFASP